MDLAEHSTRNRRAHPEPGRRGLGAQLRVTDADGKMKNWIMPRSMLADDGIEYRRHLFSMGLELASGKWAHARPAGVSRQCHPRGTRHYGAEDNCFGAWIEARGGTDSYEARTAVEQVRHFIEQYGVSRFEHLTQTEDDEDEKKLIIRDRAGYRLTEFGKVDLYCIYPEVWRREVCRGLDSVQVARILAEKGMLNTVSSASGVCPGRETRSGSTMSTPRSSSTLWIMIPKTPGSKRTRCRASLSFPNSRGLPGGNWETMRGDEEVHMTGRLKEDTARISREIPLH